MGMLAREAGALFPLLSHPGMSLPCALLFICLDLPKEPAPVFKTVEGVTGMYDFLQAGVYSSLVPAGSPEAGSLVLILEGKQSLKISEGIAEGR